MNFFYKYHNVQNLQNCRFKFFIYQTSENYKLLIKSKKVNLQVYRQSNEDDRNICLYLARDWNFLLHLFFQTVIPKKC